MDINGVNTQSAGRSAFTDQGAMGKDDFLQLLVAQMSHQNPMEPMDNTEFIGQMTQFSSLEQLENISNGIDSSVMLTQSMNNAFSTTLIGREVTIQGDLIQVNDGRAGACGFYAPTAGNAVVTITDSTGEEIRVLTARADEVGYVEIEWDQEDFEGNDVGDGEYYVSVKFEGDDGSAGEISSFITGRVTSLRFIDGNAYLTVAGREYNLAQIIEISE
ncbi:MAG: flagellar hook assembly protein FlgD [Bacteroidales bacterium]|nr:flagellar hook assembly protein FlgD [Candidatus Latescibacterota bacterium]